ncbi:hypothetical protein J1N35_025271 [Gossypium stocksii]|uniref:Uncharacterized protein n=1 Tax=Gossypium stocksii TaxID=47602 RepID=A0A9D3V8Q4_9ROSI|nr:hypothetical protein J1N35_025271 [Gossypium stocksii]
MIELAFCFPKFFSPPFQKEILRLFTPPPHLLSDAAVGNSFVEDESVLIWLSGKEEKHLKLIHVSRIISGQHTSHIDL